MYDILHNQIEYAIKLDVKMAKISLLGATGMIGRHIANRLHHEGHALTAIVRHPDQAQSALPAQVKLLAGDVENMASLKPATAADIVIFMLSVNPQTAKHGEFNPDRDGLRNLIRAVTEHAGQIPPHIVYLGSLLQQKNPHKWWVLSEKEEAVVALKSSGFHHTILRPSNIMESLPGRMQRGSSVGYIGKPKQKAYWIAAGDLADMLCVHLKSRLDRNHDLKLQGPDALTVREAAERYAAASEDTLKASGTPMFMMSFIGNFVPELKYAAHISAAMNDAEENFVGQDAWDRLGKPKITIKDFAKRHTAMNRD